MASIDPPPDEPAGPAKDYGSWSLTDLKEELRRRNAKLTGKKAQLVQRLIDYDQLFGNIINNPESCYKITEPEALHYFDVTSDSLVPSLNTDDLERFTVLTEREDVLTGANLYKEGFLLTCRLAHEDEEGVYFINSICSSEVRKTVSYKITIKLTDHLILESQCECAAGMGPYAQCKHVIAVIHGIIDFTKTRNINLHKSCTSRLQTFHQPHKTFTGNPVKAEDIVLRANNENFRKMSTFDPRPSEKDFKKLGIPPSENYENDFRNLVINFSVSCNSSMPIRHLYKRADKKALYQDHDYLKKTAAEQFIESEQLTVPQIKELEVKTRNKKVWKKERLKRLQSSEFGKICKSMEKSKKKLAKSLLKHNNITTPALKHGIKYEDKAIRLFTKKSGLAVKKCGIIINKEIQFLGSTPDGLVEEDAVLEVKCPYTARNKSISPETIEYIYLCDSTGELKLYENHNYYYQIQGQMLCSERSLAYFCIYTSKDFQIIRIQRDESFIEKMKEKLNHFYENYYLNEYCNKYLYSKRI